MIIDGVLVEKLPPLDIERRSMEIIEENLKGRNIAPLEKLVIKRAIHTSADFDYADNLKFSKNAIQSALSALKKGACIVTDTNMGKSGINKRALEALGCEVKCFIADEDVADWARKNGITRSEVSMDKAAATIHGPLIFAVGNAPTALIRLYELIKEKKISPDLVIGVPVGFVNVVQSKELIMKSGIEYIVAEGRKGGSNVAAAIVNALLYMITR